MSSWRVTGLHSGGWGGMLWSSFFHLREMIDAFILLATSFSQATAGKCIWGTSFPEGENWDLETEESDLTCDFSVDNVLGSYFHMLYPVPLRKAHFPTLFFTSQSVSIILNLLAPKAVEKDSFSIRKTVLLANRLHQSVFVKSHGSHGHHCLV